MIYTSYQIESMDRAMNADALTKFATKKSGIQNVFSDLKDNINIGDCNMVKKYCAKICKVRGDEILPEVKSKSDKKGEEFWTEEDTEELKDAVKEEVKKELKEKAKKETKKAVLNFLF